MTVVLIDVNVGTDLDPYTEQAWQFEWDHRMGVAIGGMSRTLSLLEIALLSECEV
ncbi:MAG: hypothetical protein GTO14_11235 [Anaerolineales bacterium]|nr:hypothetical protein [Anaerolineales bacterium]